MNTSNPLPPNGLDAAIALAGLFRRRALGLVRGNAADYLDLVRRLLNRYDLMWQDLYRDSMLYSWLKAFRPLAKLAAESKNLILLPPFPPIFKPETGRRSPLNRWPQIEKAAESLYSRRIVTADEFRQLDAEARQAAYTMARVRSVETLERIRDAIADHVLNGGTLKQFRAELGAELDKSLSPAQIATEYRTQIGQAYGAGQRAILAKVQGSLPYCLFSATHDARVRPDHLAMETHGQNGTAVYRADDPMWRTLWPPCGYNCRCMAIPLSIADAARHGSHEAQEWLRTGREPRQKTFASLPYSVQLPKGWPSTGRIGAIV